MNDISAQRTIFRRLRDDARMTDSAKCQLDIFLKLLDAGNIGFDNTSAMFFGFLHNPEFTHSDFCPLTQQQIQLAKDLCYEQATRESAMESAMLERVARLPLASILGTRIDIKDLAISFLTYASDEPYFAYNKHANRRLHDYLDIPDSYFLNVYNLRHDLKKIGSSIDDLIVNLSRLRTRLWVPRQMISVVHGRLLDDVVRGLPKSLDRLNSSQLEEVTMEYFDRLGFIVVRVGRFATEPDGGLDVIAYTRDSDVGEQRLAVQCKVTKNRVQPRVLREFNTSLQNAKMHKGIIIASSGFTGKAIEEVDQHGYAIDLFDYVKLSNKLRRVTDKS